MFKKFREVKCPKMELFDLEWKASSSVLQRFAQLLWSPHLFDLLLHFFHFLPYLIFQGFKHKIVGFPLWHHQLHCACCISSHFWKGQLGRLMLYSYICMPNDIWKYLGRKFSNSPLVVGYKTKTASIFLPSLLQVPLHSIPVIRR